MKKFQISFMLASLVLSMASTAHADLRIGIDIVIRPEVIAIPFAPEDRICSTVVVPGYAGPVYESSCMQDLPVLDPAFVRIRDFCALRDARGDILGYDPVCIDRGDFHFWGFVHDDRMRFGDRWNDFDRRHSDRVGGWNLRFRGVPQVRDDHRDDHGFDRGGDRGGRGGHGPRKDVGDVDTSNNPASAEGQKGPSNVADVPNPNAPVVNPAD